MAENRKWQSTLAFRRFRLKHSELSKIYWTHQLGAQCIARALAGADPEEFAVDVIAPSFKRHMFPRSVRETVEWLEPYSTRVRLHLLVVCAANLESYLRHAAYLFLASRGHVDSSLNLNMIGKALGAPILDRASLPEPLKFAEALFDVDYGSHLASWNRYYKLRSSMAHEGGIATARTVRELPDLKLTVNESLGLSWDQLRPALGAADEIAAITDCRLSSKKVFGIEAEIELLELKKQGALPHRTNVWKWLFEELGVHQIANAERDAIEARVYGRRRPKN